MYLYINISSCLRPYRGMKPWDHINTPPPLFQLKYVYISWDNCTYQRIINEVIGFPSSSICARCLVDPFVINSFNCDWFS